MTRQLEGVKPGDKIKCTRKFSRGYDLYAVESVTATLAKCTKGVSFRIDSGLMMGTGGGSGWDRRHGYLASADDVARISQDNAIQRAQEKLCEFRVTAANLAAVEALLAPQPQPEKA